MKETTVINNIEKITNKINYKRLYIEIETDTNKYTLEKEKQREIGFRVEQNTIK